jgi:hypothetical protein
LLRIDYIFVRFGLHGGLALDVAAFNDIWASGHFGLVADLAMPKTDQSI